MYIIFNYNGVHCQINQFNVLNFANKTLLPFSELDAISFFCILFLHDCFSATLCVYSSACDNVSLLCPTDSPVLHTGFVSKLRRQIRAVALPIPSLAARLLCGGRDPCNKHVKHASQASVN